MSPPHDPRAVRRILDETVPDDHHGQPATEKQIEYLLRQIELLEKQIPSPEDIAYLQRKREEDEHAMYVVQMIKKHFPWLAIVGSAIASGVYYLLTHTITISNRQ
jgi:hypothetical protein